MMFGWLFILLIALYFLTDNTNSRREKDRSTNALGILRERYARGEINTDEFNFAKSQL